MHKTTIMLSLILSLSLVSLKALAENPEQTSTATGSSAPRKIALGMAGGKKDSRKNNDAKSSLTFSAEVKTGLDSIAKNSDTERQEAKLKARSQLSRSQERLLYTESFKNFVVEAAARVEKLSQSNNIRLAELIVVLANSFQQKSGVFTPVSGNYFQGKRSQY